MVTLPVVKATLALLAANAGLASSTILPAAVGGEPPLQVVLQTGHIGSVKSVALSRDGKVVVTAADDKMVILWETASAKQLQTFYVHNAYVTSVALSGDGSYLVAGLDDGKAILWDTARGKKLQTFQVHTKRVTSVILSGDGKRVITRSGGATALWDATTAKNS
jgi:WD40 repeat protein